MASIDHGTRRITTEGLDTDSLKSFLTSYYRTQAIDGSRLRGFYTQPLVIEDTATSSPRLELVEAFQLGLPAERFVTQDELHEVIAAYFKQVHGAERIDFQGDLGLDCYFLGKERPATITVSIMGRTSLISVHSGQ